MVISCTRFGVATSPNVADLSTSFNGTNLNTWSRPSSSSFDDDVCSLDFGSTKRAPYEVLSTKASTKRRKNEGRSQALIQYAFYFSILCFSLYCLFAQIMLKNMLFDLHYAKLF